MVFARLLAPALFAFAAAVAQANPADLLRMTEQLDALDRADFRDSVRKALECVDQRDFNCANKQLTTAASRARTPADRETLAMARKALASEQVAVKRAQDEEAREIARVEASKKEMERAQEQAELDTQCFDKCTSTADLMACRQGRIYPHQCMMNDAARGMGDTSIGTAIRQGVGQTMADYQRIANAHNQMVANLQAQQAQRRQIQQMQQSQQAQVQQQRERESEPATRAGRSADLSQQQQRATERNTLLARLQEPERTAPPAPPAAGQRTVNGTLYVTAYAVLVHSRQNSRDLIVEESIAPVAWTAVLANATDADVAKAKARPFPLPESLEKSVLSGYREYIRNQYETCSAASGKRSDDGCYGLSVYIVHGASEAEVRQKREQRIGSSSRKRVASAGYRFPGSVSE